MFEIVMPTSAILVALVGMTALAFVDVHRETVEDWATALLGIFVIVALGRDGISAQQWMWGALSAVAVFGFYLELGTAGRMGGGDVKLSPLPALIVGAVNPLFAIWGVALAFTAQSAFQTVNRFAVGDRSGALPHVPAMLVGFAGSAGFSTFLFTV